MNPRYQKIQRLGHSGIWLTWYEEDHPVTTHDLPMRSALLCWRPMRSDFRTSRRRFSSCLWYDDGWHACHSQIINSVQLWERIGSLQPVFDTSSGHVKAMVMIESGHARYA